jgi:hypothetical protein
MRIGYALALALSAATPAFAQVVVTTPAPPPPPGVVNRDVGRQVDNDAARIEERKAANQAAQGNYGNASRDEQKAAQDRAAAQQ